LFLGFAASAQAATYWVSTATGANDNLDHMEITEIRFFRLNDERLRLTNPKLT